MFVFQRRSASVLVGLVLLAACAAPAQTEAPGASASPSAPPLRHVRLLLGFRPDVQFAPFYLAQQAGFYADVGLDVSIEFKSGGDLVRLVADGQAEIGVADATDVMISRTQGIPVTYVATLYDQFPVALILPATQVSPRPAPDLRTQLQGKRIGTPGRYGSSWHALLAILDAAGLTESDVTIREYPQYNQTEGLLNGDVDLITGFLNNEPLRLVAAGMQVQVLTLDQIAPLPGPGMITGDGLLASDPTLVKSFVAATVRAQAAISADPQRGLQAASVAVPTIAVDPATALAVLNATIDLWRGAGAAPTGLINRAVWASGYATMERLGFIDGSVPLDEMISPMAPGAA